MIKPYQFFIAPLLLATLIWSAPIQWGLEGGTVQPWGDLEQKIESGYFGNLTLSYPYTDHLDGYMQAGYAYLPVESAHFAGLHQLNGRAGLDFEVPWVAPLRWGGGVSLIFVRGDTTTAQAAQYMLYDNESEFGWHAQLSLPAIKRNQWKAGFRIHWEQIWTQPVASELFWFGIYLQGNPW